MSNQDSQDELRTQVLDIFDEYSVWMLNRTRRKEFHDKLFSSINAHTQKAVTDKEVSVLSQVEELYCNDENILLDYLRMSIAKLTNQAEPGDA